MKNKTIAIIGIASYILGVISSAENLSGNFISPGYLIVFSGILRFIFIIIAAVRLWKVARGISIILVISEIIFIILTVIQEVTSSQYGSPTIIFLNMTKIVNLLVFIYAIILLWKIKTKTDSIKM